MIRRQLLIFSVVIVQILSSCTSTQVAVISSKSNCIARVPSSEVVETPWTKWSEENSEIRALFMLSDIRKSLLKNNLSDPHINYSGYKPVDCQKINTKFRSADGTCYDLENPNVGAAGVAFGRNVAPEYIDSKASQKLMTPNPALVSDTFFKRDEFKPVPDDFLNMLAAVWIQFMNHDWLTHGPNLKENPYVVVGPDGTTHTVDKTKTIPENAKSIKNNFGKVSLNDVTHWWDASQIYGSSRKEQSELREFSKGRMKMVAVNGNNLLPKNQALNPANNRQNQGYEATGFRDNWWIGLSLLHTVFVREHNAIADMLMKKYVEFNQQTNQWIWKGQNQRAGMTAEQVDEEVFQTARLVNAAILAKIHTVEWTPAILPNKTLKRGMNFNWYGAINPKSWIGDKLDNVPILGKKLSETDWFKFTKSGYVIGGIVGDKKNNHGVPFSITEEFTSVYRLHSLLPENLVFKNAATKKVIAEVPFIDTRNDKAYSIMENYSTKDLFYSFGTQLPGQLVLNNFPDFMKNLKIPGHGTMDLGMVDIIRDRERGTPRYNQFRRAIGLTPIKNYRDFFPAKTELNDKQKEVIRKFEQVYGFDSVGNDNVEMIDLLVGTLAEEVRPAKFGFGETMFQIFILMASRRLMADPYFTDYYNEEHYTKAGLQWIDREGTLAKVIGRHMPELKPNMQGLSTAFEPWKK